MRAASIRIVAPIPGRGAVGVEVPNPIAEIVAFRELIEARDYPERARRAADRARQGSRGQAGHRRPREDAAPAHRRRDGLGQIGLREHDHHEPRLPAHAEDAPLPDGRPEDGRALGVQRAAAPAAQGRHRQPRRGVGAQVGGARDAGPLRAARRERLPQHSGLQPARAGRRGAQAAEAPGRRVRGAGVQGRASCRTSSS